MSLTENAQTLLLQLARDAIAYGMQHHSIMPVTADHYADALNEPLACFVTLNINGNLRGCIGHLEAIQPLVLDVVENAYSAAFRDPRFSPLGQDELDSLDIHISVLTPPEPMAFSSEQDLLEQIQPGIDGLILEDGYNRGTFLPSVWESLPEKKDFWKHLKMKAGLPVDHWSEQLQVSRYGSESFGEHKLK